MPHQLPEWAVPVRVSCIGTCYVYAETMIEAANKAQELTGLGGDILNLDLDEFTIEIVTLRGTPEKIA